MVEKDQDGGCTELWHPESDHSLGQSPEEHAIPSGVGLLTEVCLELSIT
jgi:hypothetical protein